MMMSNGSILVVGGKDSGPQPSLEILPKPPGGDTVIALDFLQRTNLNSLYPFLLVLQSGRIFIGEDARRQICISTNAACFQVTTTKPVY